MKTKTGITQENLTKAAHALNFLLADEFLLFTKTKNAHWNVDCTNFHSLHVFFETQFKTLDEIVDSIAERIRSQGNYAPATLQSFLELTHFTERSLEKNDGPGLMNELLNDHESIITQFRGYAKHFAEVMKDVGTGDFITGVIIKNEEMARMLRRNLKR